MRYLTVGYLTDPNQINKQNPNTVKKFWLSLIFISKHWLLISKCIQNSCKILISEKFTQQPFLKFETLYRWILFCFSKRSFSYFSNVSWFFSMDLNIYLFLKLFHVSGRECATNIFLIMWCLHRVGLWDQNKTSWVIFLIHLSLIPEIQVVVTDCLSDINQVRSLPAWMYRNTTAVL